MNKKQLIAISLIFSFAFPLYAGPNNLNIMTGEYKVIRRDNKCSRLIITHKNKAIYEITPRYIEQFGSSTCDHMYVDLIYDNLTPRRLHKDIVPFEDITGDGVPDLVIREYPSPGTVYMPFVVRVLSISKDFVTEYDPMQGDGEVYYFADFNKDGVLEFVNTDMEGDFVYSQDGIPISDNVWILDKERNKYIKTSSIETAKKYWDEYENDLYAVLKTEHPDVKDTAEIEQSMGFALLKRNNQWERATVHFKKAVELDPKLYMSWYRLGLINIDSEEGYNYFKKTAEANPKFSTPYYWMAYYRCRYREDKKAIPLFKKYLEVAETKKDPEEEGRIKVAKEALADLLAGKDGQSLNMMRKPK